MYLMLNIYFYYLLAEVQNSITHIYWMVKIIYIMPLNASLLTYFLDKGNLNPHTCSSE